MTRRGSSAVLQQIQTLFTAGSLHGLSDRQLLSQFVARRDAVAELAFTTLVERHGPMVLGVCRRILADRHDAEDAFQATFLVLVHQAGSIRVEGSLGRWLYGVARRVAGRARANARHRQALEQSGRDRVDARSADTPEDIAELADIRSVLAEELGKLAHSLQAVIVLCDVEGSSHEEAARRLGWPIGTVKSRLSRARGRLRTRLIRRGLAPPNLLDLMPFFAINLPRRLVDCTSRAACGWIPERMLAPQIISASVAALTEGVLRTMFLTKLKLAAAALLLVVTGSVVLMNQASAQKPVASTGLEGGRQDRSGTATRLDEVDLAMLERAWADAISRRDEAVIGRILADDFEGIEPLGAAFSRAKYVADLRSGAFGDQPVVVDEIKARLFGDFAVVTSRISAGNVPAPGRTSHIYARRQGRWLCVAAHGSSGEMTWGLPGGLPPASGAPEQTHDSIKTDSLFLRQMLVASRGAVTLHTPSECRVERIHVYVGKLVSEGDPVAELSSRALAHAKNEYRSKAARWENDREVLRSRQQCSASDFDSQQLLVEAQKNESRSLLEFQIAIRRLAAWGLDDQEIKAVAAERGEQHGRLTLRSPIMGTVVVIKAKVGGLYDSKSALMVIFPPSGIGPVFTR